ncbi:unnamed protein product [Rhizophagus irregularis]|nr:unnamed protein product [Rhizophagus irregularis]
MSAKNGNIVAQYKLGYCYSNGAGTNINNVKAFEWYLKSAEGGIAKAQYYVYYDGIGIVNKVDKAIYWYRKASKNGIREAKDKLASILPYY